MALTHQKKQEITKKITDYLTSIPVQTLAERNTLIEGLMRLIELADKKGDSIGSDKIPELLIPISDYMNEEMLSYEADPEEEDEAFSLCKQLILTHKQNLEHDFNPRTAEETKLVSPSMIDMIQNLGTHAFDAVDRFFELVIENAEQLDRKAAAFPESYPSGLQTFSFLTRGQPEENLIDQALESMGLSYRK